MPPTDFASWFKEQMAARQMSQRMLSHLSGVEHSTISRILDRQHATPQLTTALALGAVFRECYSCLHLQREPMVPRGEYRR